MSKRRQWRSRRYRPVVSVGHAWLVPSAGPLRSGRRPERSGPRRVA